MLVTGGGGWIGSEIARQVAGFGPSQLVLLDHDETHLHDTVYDLQGIADPEVVLADIRDASGDRRGVPPGAARDRVPRRRAQARPHPRGLRVRGVRTNVFGTLNVVDACARVDVAQLVCISTDKAATPTSVMGASKWLAEQIVLERAN